MKSTGIRMGAIFNMPEILYPQLCATLEERILAGSYSGRLPGIHRLAAEFGTTPVTMSKALKRLERRGYVSIVDRQGAFVTLRRGDRPRRRLIGWVKHIGGLDSHDELYEELRSKAAEQNYRVVALSSSSLDIFREEEFLQAIHVDGYIFSGGVLDSVIVHNLKVNGIPFVSVNQIDEPNSINLVEHDHEHGRPLLYENLFQLGHRRIAEIISGNILPFWTRKLEKIYRDFMTGHEIFRSEYYTGNAESNLALARRYGDRWREDFIKEQLSGLFALPEPPTVIVCNTIGEAQIALQLLRERGLSVPEDLSLAVIEILDYPSQKTDPFFTRLIVDNVWRQREAIHMLMELIDVPEAPVQEKRLPLRLATGISVATLKKHFI